MSPRSADLQRLRGTEGPGVADAHLALVLARNLESGVVGGHRARELLERRLVSTVGMLLARLDVARAVRGLGRAQYRLAEVRDVVVDPRHGPAVCHHRDRALLRT